MRFIASFNAILMHFYFVYFPGQQIIDHSLSVFDSWYIKIDSNVCLFITAEYIYITFLY